MKTYILIFLTIIFVVTFFSITKAQPNILWSKTFGGSNIDVGYFVQETNDLGFIIAGYTRSYGTMSGRNVWLIKTDHLGNELWNKAFGGNNDEEAYSVKQTSDGGYILAGYTKSFGAGGTDVYVIKTDPAGNEIWSKFFGGSQDDEAYDIVQTMDGGYLIAAVTSSFAVGGRDAWLIKINSSGIQQWTKSLGGLASDGVRSIQLTSDGGFIFTGWTYSYGGGSLGNAWLVKTDSLGNIIWHKAFGGSDVDRGYSVKQLNDGGYILTGYTSSFGNGLDDMLLIRTDSLGNDLWRKYIGGTGRDYGNSVVQTPDGGFAVTGYTLSYGAGGDDVWLVKTDSLGNTEWIKTYGGTASDVGYCLIISSDFSFVIVGHTLSFGAGVHDVWLIKTVDFIPVELISFNASLLNDIIELKWSTASETNNYGFEIERRIDNGQLTIDNWESIGFINGFNNSTSIKEYTFKDDISTLLSLCLKINYRLKQINIDGQLIYSDIVSVDINSVPLDFVLYQNYPNPFNPVTTIKFSVPNVETLYGISLRIFDVLGNEVVTLINTKLLSGIYEIKWDATEVSSGIYYCQLIAGDYIAIKKMILMK